MLPPQEGDEEENLDQAPALERDAEEHGGDARDAAEELQRAVQLPPAGEAPDDGFLPERPLPEDQEEEDLGVGEEAEPERKDGEEMEVRVFKLALPMRSKKIKGGHKNGNGDDFEVEDRWLSRESNSQ